MWEMCSLNFYLSTQKAIRASESEDVHEELWFSEWSSMDMVGRLVWCNGRNTVPKIRGSGLD